jgi:hypothetical protein
MGREIMAALKRFETGADGDSLTVGGNLIVSGTSTVAALNTSGAVVFNDAGADVDFRVEGDTDANLLFVDASTDRVGIGTNTPDALLSVDGIASFGAGSASTPSIAAAGDLDTGIFFPAANTMVFSMGATERVRINANGFFKASNTGSYNNTTSEENEFRSNSNNITLWVHNTNASYSVTGIFGGNLISNTTRSANSAFSLITALAGGDAEFVFRGDGNGYADGTFNNNGADYAEFFESANGQALTLGATVVLDGNKVREATDQDPASAIIGVVRPKEPSKASMVVGNTAWNKWANKYLTDDFDRYIMEDHDVVEWTDAEGKDHSYESQNIPAGITVPADATRKTHDDKGIKFQHYKLNPAWNPDAEYVNRENRPEWNIIGLLGQVKILKGQPVGDRWFKMGDVSETVEEWMIR